MRILWYSSGLFQEGGGERLKLEGIRHFQSLGLPVVLFVEHRYDWDQNLFNGRYKVPLLHSTSPEELKLGPLGWIPGLKQLIAQAGRLWCVHRYNPDVIIANSPADAVKIYFLNLFRLKKIPYVCHIFGSFFQFAEDRQKYAWIFRKSFDEIWGGDPVYQEVIPRNRPATALLATLKIELVNLLQYLAVKGAKTIFVLSEKNKREIELLYQHSNVKVLRGAYTTDVFSASQKEDKKQKHGASGRPVIFSLCRLISKKRVDLILKGFAELQKRIPNAVLWIGGNGPEKSKLQDLAKELKIDVNFLGFVPDDELVDYYLSADVFTAADNADYDITTWMGVALGKKIVAPTQHEFPQELIQLGLVFQAEPNPNGFAEAFTRALNSSSLPAQAERQKIMSEYSWESYFNHILTQLKEAVAS